MLEKLGRKLAQGAKAEILEPVNKNEIDWRKVINAGLTVLEFGVFIFSMFAGSKSQSESSTTVIVNNYMYKEDK